MSSDKKNTLELCFCLLVNYYCYFFIWFKFFFNLTQPCMQEIMYCVVSYIKNAYKSIIYNK